MLAVIAPHELSQGLLEDVDLDWIATDDHCKTL